MAKLVDGTDQRHGSVARVVTRLDGTGAAIVLHGCTGGQHGWTARVDSTGGQHGWTARVGCTGGRDEWTAQVAGMDTNIIYPRGGRPLPSAQCPVRLVIHWCLNAIE